MLAEDIYVAKFLIGYRSPVTIYASPSGSPIASGASDDPFTLSAALVAARTGDTIILQDGLYTLDTLAIPDDVNMRAAPGARPIIVHSDGEPPAGNIGDRCDVSLIWLGGTRPASEVGSRSIVFGTDANFHDCTLFNYIQGLQVGSDAHGNILRRNRLVGCGYGALYHPIYVANQNASQASHQVLTEENIVVGSQGGYGVQLYHEPNYALAQYNFLGDGAYGLAIEGDTGGPVSGNRNIIWTCSNAPLFDSILLGTCRYNVFQGCSQPNPGTSDFDNNFFVDPALTAGTNPVVWQEADVVSNLGDSSANIDAAISALETSFADSVANIHDDATIETNFAVLKAVIDAWKAA